MAGLTSFDELYTDANNKYVQQKSLVEKYEAEYNIMNKETKTAAKKKMQIETSIRKRNDLYNIANIYKDSIGQVAISEGCKSHLVDVWIAHEFNRPTKDIRSKYIEKGIMMEEEGINLYSALKGRFVEKSVERRDNHYIMGEIDLLDGELIVDNKCSWDLWTFFKNIKFINKPEQNPYYANMQGYMYLWEKASSKVVYTLIDTPANLIKKEKEYLLKDFIGTQEMYEEACKELERNLTFSDIDAKRRMIEIRIDRDEAFIEKIKPTVIACREYLNSLKDIYYEMD